MTTPYPAHFEPLVIGHLRLKNRIMSTSHAPAYAEDGMPKERYRRYHEEKAKGGLALSMFGGSSTVSVDSPPPFGQIDLGEDRVIPWLRAFAEAVHRHGCATMIQITHMGRRTGWSSHGWLPTIAPSAVREPAHRSFPRAMDRDDIDRVIRDFAAAAGRAHAGGIDGCELSVLGHLGGQFWSPAVNRRTDGYGGSPANRARFTLETLEAMRERAPDRFLIGMRFTMDELVEGGLHEDDAMEIVRLHVDAGLVDFLNVTVGTSFDHAGLSFTVPNMSHPIAPHVDRVKRIRDASGAEFLAARGAKVELATPDRSIAFELGATNFSVHLKNLYRAGVALTPDVRLVSVRPRVNALEARFRNVYSGETSARTVDQVVVEHGTVPAAELFHALERRSGNRGRTAADALARGAPQPLGPAGTFSLFRVGDAVASRNIHAALYDSLRICKDL